MFAEGTKQEVLAALHRAIEWNINQSKEIYCGSDGLTPTPLSVVHFTDAILIRALADTLLDGRIAIIEEWENV